MTKRGTVLVAYKHMKKDYAAAFARGAEIPLGTYEFYRRGESPRTDKMEGAVKYNVDHTSHPEDNPGWQTINPILDSLAGENTSISMINTTIQTNLPPAYLFCCSWEPDQELIDQGQAVLKIDDLRTFGKRLLQDNRKLLLKMHVGAVNYVAREGNPFAAQLPPEGPFFKDPKLAHEKELRLVFETRPNPPPEPFKLFASSKAARLVRRIA